MAIVASMIALGILIATAACAFAQKRAASSMGSHGRVRHKVDRARERDAFYMRNFWNYDGSEQEEFEE